MPPDLAFLSTLIGSNYPCLELIFIVPKMFEPSKFDCIFTLVSIKTLTTNLIFKSAKTEALKHLYATTSNQQRTMIYFDVTDVA